jgi:hypothetical protein
MLFGINLVSFVCSSEITALFVTLIYEVSFNTADILRMNHYVLCALPDVLKVKMISGGKC